MVRPREQRVLELMRRSGVPRPCDFEAQGIPCQYLRILRERDLAEQVSRSLYVLDGQGHFRVPGMETTHLVISAVRRRSW